ncbi:MAG: Sua5/YciO/YrdC/YwlC family protein, partial [Pseudomonadota bacterium]
MTVLSDILAELEAGGLAILPTETVFGLCADATDPDAVAAIYRAKGRPSYNPLIAHVCDLAMAERYGVLDGRA